MCIITTLIIEFEFLVTQSVPLTPNHACMSERHFCGDQARLSDDFYAPVSPSIKHFKMVSLKFKPFKVITRVQFILRDSFQPLRKLFFFLLSHADTAFHQYVSPTGGWIGTVNKAHSPHNWMKNKKAHGKSVFWGGWRTPCPLPGINLDETPDNDTKKTPKTYNFCL